MKIIIFFIWTFAIYIFGIWNGYAEGLIDGRQEEKFTRNG